MRPDEDGKIVHIVWSKDGVSGGDEVADGDAAEAEGFGGGRSSVYEDVARGGSTFANWAAANFQVVPWRTKTLV